MSIKITKSELKEMIREALREELHLRESTENTGCERITNIESALEQAYTSNANALVVTKPGMSSIAKARAWCEANSLLFILTQQTKIYRVYLILRLIKFMMVCYS